MNMRERQLFIGTSIIIVLIGAFYLEARTAGNVSIVKHAAVPEISYPVALISSEHPPENQKKIVPESALAAVRAPEQTLFRRVKESDIPNLSLASALVIDLSGTQYFALNSSARWPTASLTKLMTAVVAREILDLQASIPLGNEVQFAGDAASSSAREVAKYRVEDVIGIMLVASQNNAAEALANAGGRNAFLLRMNARAKLWELNDTYFEDPSGLSASNQSTAEDLAKLLRRIASDYPDLLALTGRDHYRAIAVNTGESLTFKSTNTFAGKPEFLGGKTGFTDEAQGNLISVFRVQGTPVMVVVLGTNDRFGDTEKILNWFTHDFTRNY